MKETEKPKRGMRHAWALAACLALACGPGGDGAGDGDPADDLDGEGPAVAEDAFDAPVVPTDPEPWTPELAAELLDIRETDQAVRADFGAGSLQDTAFMGRMIRADSALSRRVRELVARHGWPRTSDVGEDAVQGAFLVVQHSPFRAWQEALLPHVRAAAEAGEIDGQSFAMLHDRVHMHMGLPQRYGTQLTSGGEDTLRLHALEDTAAVDSLRAGLGLPPLADYFDVIEEQTGMAVDRTGFGG